MTDRAPQLLPSIRAGSPLEAELRDSLEAIARNGSHELRQQIEAVLRGQLSLREFATTGLFRELAAPAVARATDAVREMPAEQRRRLEEQAEDQFGTSFT